jgi:hypothetical protein
VHSVKKAHYAFFYCEKETFLDKHFILRISFLFKNKKKFDIVHFMATTDFQAARPEILFHHCLTCGRESINSPSPALNNFSP